MTFSKPITRSKQTFLLQTHLPPHKKEAPTIRSALTMISRCNNYLLSLASFSFRAASSSMSPRVVFSTGEEMAADSSVFAAFLAAFLAEASF